ncbi:MAG: CoA-binding protein [Desulfobacterales bacterium]|nr:MAG: CoA-binding protein [Desulfobacterales bacterium]
MESNQELIAQIDDLFHPQSIAIVGAPRGLKSGSVFLMALLEQGFSGKIYPVNPQAAEISGIKAYPSVSDIPGSIDLAIVLVPHHSSLAVIRECAAKGVKGAVLFTAGYKETGTEEGRALEAELVRVARSAGMRLIGPNGMGLYSPKTGLAFFPQMSKDPGPVGIISHSGSLTNIMGVMAPQKGIRFSKVISLGNECDLTAADFLTYLSHDSETGLIGAYIEGIKNGANFLKALRQASLQKPVIIWKVGLTREGSRASASHTGALAGSRKIWQAMVRQAGVIPIVGFEAWVDALMGFSLLPSNTGPRVAIISGPGGLAVSAAEACGNQGLKLAELSEQSQSELAKFVPLTGTSLRNPVDVSLTAHFDIDIFKQAARTVAADHNVDAVAIIGCGLTPEDNHTFVDNMIRVQKECRKPLLMVKIPGFDPKLSQHFCEVGLPFFDSAESAMRTYALICNYQRWCQTHSDSD